MQAREIRRPNVSHRGETESRSDLASYLSEHHLRKDAEEREIMTKTYLALTKDAVAADADRHIILNGLFRNSADGIVKDEGGLDPSLAAAIARIGMGGR